MITGLLLLLLLTAARLPSSHHQRERLSRDFKTKKLGSGELDRGREPRSASRADLHFWRIYVLLLNHMIHEVLLTSRVFPCPLPGNVNQGQKSFVRLLQMHLQSVRTALDRGGRRAAEGVCCLMKISNAPNSLRPHLFAH